MSLDVSEELKIRYRTCSSYSDEGSITVSDPSGSILPSIEIRFNTAFQRNRFFTYELTQRSQKIGISYDGKDFVVNIPNHDVNNSSTVIEALRAVAGVSQGASMLVPFLLQATDADIVFASPTDGNVQCTSGDEICYQVTETFLNFDKVTFWISGDFILKKVKIVDEVSLGLQLKLLGDAGKVIPAINEISPISSFRTEITYNFDNVSINP